MCHFQEGNQNKIAFIFSCPGRKEEIANCPVAGTTGENLKTLLNMLNEESEITEFNNISFDDLRITNAWDKIEHKDKTNRTEPDLSEIIEEKNLDRLQSEINDINKIVICCGKNAKYLVSILQYAQKLDSNLKIIFIRHLSMLSINNIEYDINGNKLEKGVEGNTKKRLKTLSNEIKEKYINY